MRNRIKKFFHNFHYKQTNNYKLLDWVIFIILLPLSYIYLLINTIRLFLYSKNILKSEHPGVKVISVGNLSTGGTGKTPVTQDIAEYISNQKGYNVAILSRGYGRKSKEEIVEVKANNKILAKSPDECGDEPFMLANSLNNVTILVGSKRVLLARRAIEKYGCNLLILDDGFQHLAIKRDLNIIVSPEGITTGNGWVLPLGPLREPLEEMKRANAGIILNKDSNNLNNKLDENPTIINDIPFFKVDYIFKEFINLKTSSTENTLEDQKVLIFCGIGQPEFFAKHLENLNLNISKSIFFTDHQTYTQKEIEQIINSAKKHEVNAIITTQKDAGKILQYLPQFDLPVYSMRMKTTLDVENLLKTTNFYD